MSSSLLSVQHVWKQYGAYTALHNVSLEVPQASIFGLLGPNGAGKTSLIRILNQITAPDKGQVLWKGQPLNPDLGMQVGYLPEERGLYKKMEVGEQALYLARLKGLSREEALRRLKFWFEKFEMQGWWKKKLEDLSKGMQQKVQFVTTVVHEPELLILDEPFSGFDPINAHLIKEELLRLKTQGTTILLSTHNMSSVEELCSHIALLNKSRKLLEGSVADIRRKHANNEWEIMFKGSLLAFTNAHWGGFKLVHHRPEGEATLARISLTDGFSLNALLQHVLQEVEVVGLREYVPTMNEVFIRQVSGQDVVPEGNFTE